MQASRNVYAGQVRRNVGGPDSISASAITGSPRKALQHPKWHSRGIRRVSRHENQSREVWLAELSTSS